VVQLTGAGDGKYNELHTKYRGMSGTFDLSAYLARQLGARQAQGLVPRPDTDQRPADWREVEHHESCLLELTVIILVTDYAALAGVLLRYRFSEVIETSHM